jgi:formaldehyde-activating enzyme involved in methanogenesis
MPERDPQVLEVLLGQMLENALIDVVLGKAPGVLGQAE